MEKRKGIKQLSISNFLKSSQSAGVILILCTAVSLLLANLFLGYSELWKTALNLSLGEIAINGNIEFWINDFLMAIFFLYVGLEIKREIIVGELSGFKRAILPLLVAISGMLFPALIYVALNYNHATINGWAIPSATDIAFALGALSLLGERVPSSLKVFLTALAVIDDLGAIVVIGLFYGHGFELPFFVLALLTAFVVFVLNKLGIRKIWIYLLLGLPLWFFMLKSGIHATISGVLLAFVIPLDKGKENSISTKLEHALQNPVNFFIMPVFALANTAIPINNEAFAAMLQPHCLGAALGLMLGKPIGVLLATYAAVKSKLALMPTNTNKMQLLGVGCLAGIGFTMSIFITMLAFNQQTIIAQTKLAIILASIISGLLGYLILKYSSKKIFRKHTKQQH